MNKTQLPAWRRTERDKHYKKKKAEDAEVVGEGRAKGRGDGSEREIQHAENSKSQN